MTKQVVYEHVSSAVLQVTSTGMGGRELKELWTETFNTHSF
jgi:hypothetical protein